MQISEAIRQAHDRHYPAIAEILADVVEAQHGDGHLLSQMCRYHLGTGGKRLRALLPCLVAEALGRSAGPIYPFAAACEMLHNATLVHDDLQDGDTTRRGFPTVWAHYSTAQAINLGDGMYFYALLCLDQLDMFPELRWQVAQQLMTSTVRVIDGQVREFSLKEFAAPRPEQYLSMVERKTSALFELPLVGSARLCGASPELCDALTEAAAHLGIIFQLQDDILDLYGDKGRNEPGSDIREGKISALVVHALELADDADRTRLRAVLFADRLATSPDDVSWAINMMDKCGALSAALMEIKLREEQVATLSGLSVEPALRELVTQLTTAFVAPIAHLFATQEVGP